MAREMEIVSAQEMAEYLHVSTGTVINYAKAGIVPGFKIGKLWRFDKAEAERRLKRLLRNSPPAESIKSHSD